jgi:hypothetical protein
MSLAELLVVFLFVRVYPFDVVCAPDFHFCAMTPQVVGVLAVLREGVGKGGPDTGLSERASVLLLEHVLLLPQLFEPRVLEGLTGGDPIIGVVNK